jgi:hypothetical protein
MCDASNILDDWAVHSVIEGNRHHVEFSLPSTLQSRVRPSDVRPHQQQQIENKKRAESALCNGTAVKNCTKKKKYEVKIKIIIRKIKIRHLSLEQNTFMYFYVFLLFYGLFSLKKNVPKTFPLIVGDDKRKRIPPDDLFIKGIYMRY